MGGRNTSMGCGRSEGEGYKTSIESSNMVGVGGRRAFDEYGMW